MPLRLVAVALSLLLSAAVPAHARPTPASQPSRHYRATAAELLAADDLNAMVLGILHGQPQPAPSGSEAHRRRARAAWARLRGLLLGEQRSDTRLLPAEIIAEVIGGRRLL